jgi:hypothetical protein
MNALPGPASILFPAAEAAAATYSRSIAGEEDHAHHGRGAFNERDVHGVLAVALPMNSLVPSSGSTSQKFRQCLRSSKSESHLLPKRLEPSRPTRQAH